MTTQVKSGRPKRGAEAIAELGMVAAASTAISTFIAVILPASSVGRDASRLLFVLVAGLLGLFMGFARSESRRFSAGFFFVFFLFEPIGRVLLRQDTGPTYLLLTFPLAIAAAYLFGSEGGSGNDESTVANNSVEGDQ